MRFIGRLKNLSAETSTTPIWLPPIVASAAGYGGAIWLCTLRPGPGSFASKLWPGDADSASGVLQTVAASVMGATTLLFSITLVALQLASQQFSPRLLRAFAQDRTTKSVVTVLSLTFVFCTTVMRGLRAETSLPTVAVFVAHLLGVASLIAILFFVAHMLRAVRVDTMMLIVHEQTERAIQRFYSSYDDDALPSPDVLELDDSTGTMVSAVRSGYLRSIDVEKLVDIACQHDGIIRLEVRAGDHVVQGSPIATVWADDEQACRALAKSVYAAIEFGYERTLEQDAAFGFRQIEDIAVRAMSPGINDPATAAAAVAYLGDLLVQLCGRRLGPTLHVDENGRGRAVVPDRDLRYYLELSCGQLRRFGAAEPTVLGALLRMLRDVAVACRDTAQREEVRRVADRVVAAVREDVSDADTQTVQDLRERVELALRGDVRCAFADRAGETRSM